MKRFLILGLIVALAVAFPGCAKCDDEGDGDAEAAGANQEIKIDLEALKEQTDKTDASEDGSSGK